MDIIKEVNNNIGLLTLNRPNKLNSLNYEMLSELEIIIDKWKNDKDIKLMILEGAGEKAFCAGGDVLGLLNDYILNPMVQDKMQLFTKEFEVDLAIQYRPFPVVTHWKGVTMGGGIGFSIGSDIILADETVKWAMPETSLGFMPDVGMGYYFSRMDKPLSLHISLTGRIISGADAVKLGFATHYIDSKDYPSIRGQILSCDFSEMSYEDIVNKIKEIIEPFKQPLPETDLDRDMENINNFYNKNTLDEIFQGLEESDSDFAKKELETLKEKCPMALAIQFDKYFRGKEWGKAETFKKDFLLIKEMLDMGNLEEGITTTMVEKDRKPKWNPPTLEDVDWYRIKVIMTEEELAWSKVEEIISKEPKE